MPEEQSLLTPPGMTTAPDMVLAEALGGTILAMLTSKSSAKEARAFAVALTVPTLPGTPEREFQDAAWGRLMNRLVSATKGEA